MNGRLVTTKATSIWAGAGMRGKWWRDRIEAHRCTLLDQDVQNCTMENGHWTVENPKKQTKRGGGGRRKETPRRPRPSEDLVEINLKLSLPWRVGSSSRWAARARCAAGRRVGAGDVRGGQRLKAGGRPKGSRRLSLESIAGYACRASFAESSRSGPASTVCGWQPPAFGCRPASDILGVIV